MRDFLQEKKVLIVEDNVVNQKVMEKLVKIFGHHAIVMEDGFKVFDFVKTEKPDLILMDIQLVGISGIDITYQIKSNDDLKSIPVIVVTASATETERQKIIKESLCDDYIAKPFFPQELSDKMANFIPVKEVNLN